ncbi:MAG: penicillin acylase family protein, partial [Saprospiraceae bacterium]|nr:penicillin acylase family protein [Saprospiraceae bacterium]
MDIGRQLRTMFRNYCFSLVLLTLPYCVVSQIKPASIDIVRDSFGVPHIFAKTDAEVAYGLAWA